MRFTGIEITIYDVNGVVIAQPVYEAHTVARAVEIIDATKKLVGNGCTFTFRTLQPVVAVEA